jgi:hypothetical protein
MNRDLGSGTILEKIRQALVFAYVFQIDVEGFDSRRLHQFSPCFWLDFDRAIFICRVFAVAKLLPARSVL